MKTLLIAIALMFVITFKSPTNEFLLLGMPIEFRDCLHGLEAGEFLFLNTRDSTLIIGVIRCPDNFEKGFFKEGSTYELTFLIDSLLTDYNRMNFFKRTPDVVAIRAIDDIKLIKR